MTQKIHHLEVAKRHYVVFAIAQMTSGSVSYAEMLDADATKAGTPKNTGKTPRITLHWKSKPNMCGITRVIFGFIDSSAIKAIIAKSSNSPRHVLGVHWRPRKMWIWFRGKNSKMQDWNSRIF